MFCFIILQPKTTFARWGRKTIFTVARRHDSASETSAAMVAHERAAVSVLLRDQQTVELVRLPVPSPRRPASAALKRLNQSRVHVAAQPDDESGGVDLACTCFSTCTRTAARDDQRQGTGAHTWRPPSPSPEASADLQERGGSDERDDSHAVMAVLRPPRGASRYRWVLVPTPLYRASGRRSGRVASWGGVWWCARLRGRGEPPYTNPREGCRGPGERTVSLRGLRDGAGNLRNEAI